VVPWANRAIAPKHRLAFRPHTGCASARSAGLQRTAKTSSNSARLARAAASSSRRAASAAASPCQATGDACADDAGEPSESANGPSGLGQGLATTAARPAASSSARWLPSACEVRTPIVMPAQQACSKPWLTLSVPRACAERSA